MTGENAAAAADAFSSQKIFKDAMPLNSNPLTVKKNSFPAGDDGLTVNVLRAAVASEYVPQERSWIFTMKIYPTNFLFAKPIVFSAD
jgi:hypothetical protein